MASFEEILFFVSFIILIVIFFLKLINTYLYVINNSKEKDIRKSEKLDYKVSNGFKQTKYKCVALTMFLTIANILFFSILNITAIYNFDNMLMIIFLKFSTVIFTFNFLYVGIELLLYLDIFALLVGKKV